MTSDYISLTKGQKTLPVSILKVLLAIDCLQKKRGYPPTIRELADYLGYTTPQYVVKSLLVLKNAKLVSYTARKARTVRLTCQIEALAYRPLPKVK